MPTSGRGLKSKVTGVGGRVVQVVLIQERNLPAIIPEVVMCLLRSIESDRARLGSASDQSARELPSPGGRGEGDQRVWTVMRNTQHVSGPDISVDTSRVKCAEEKKKKEPRARQVVRGAYQLPTN